MGIFISYPVMRKFALLILFLSFLLEIYVSRIFGIYVILNKTGKNSIEKEYGKNPLDKKGMTVKELARQTSRRPRFTQLSSVTPPSALTQRCVFSMSSILLSIPFASTILMRTWKHCKNFPPIKSV